MTTFFARDPSNLMGIEYFNLLFAMTIYSPNPTFVPSLSKIGDLSCITLYLLPGSHGPTFKFGEFYCSIIYTGGKGVISKV